MRSLPVLLFSGFSLCAQTPDLYPQVRSLVLEAEALSTNMRLLKDRSNPHTWAGDILAHAGYLEDAERAYAKSPGPNGDPPYILWRAWVVYGHRERAEKLLEGTTNPEKRAAYGAAFADLLWRMGQPAQARQQYEAARVVAAKIVDPAKRKQSLASIDQGLKFVSDPPPNLISANPSPSPRGNVQDSPIPPFPITAGGFQDPDPKTADRAAADAELIKQLYDRAAAGDRASVERMIENATTPFRKALAIASIEHVFIQLGRPEEAEQYAKSIPETDSSSSLAKAEALSAAGTAWVRALNDDRARTDFNSAKSIASSVPDLPLGRVSVLVSIATAQIRGRMIEDGEATFRQSIELAQKFPDRPATPQGVRRPPTPPGIHYKDEAFEKIVHAAIQVRSVKIAHDAVKIWSMSGDNAESALVDAWLAAGRTDEAIDAARRIKDPERRVSELLSLARSLLDDAGAPIF
jgi:hypothetical protein